MGGKSKKLIYVRNSGNGDMLVLPGRWGRSEGPVPSESGAILAYNSDKRKKIMFITPMGATGEVKLWLGLFDQGRRVVR